MTRDTTSILTDRPVWSRVALALGAAGLVWILFGASGRNAGREVSTPRSVSSASIAFFEQRLSERPASYTTANALVDRYLLRFREVGAPVDVERAAELATLAADQAPWDAGALRRLAAVHLARHKFVAAEAAARSAAALDPNVGDAVLFDALFERGAYEEAAEVLTRLKPGSTARLLRLARLEEHEGNLKGAAVALARACEGMSRAGIRGAPLAWCLAERGHVALAQARASEAKRWFRRALELHPGERGALEAMAWTAYREGELNEAHALYSRLVTAFGEADVHMQLATIAERSGDAATARRHIEAFEAEANRAESEAIYRRQLALFYSGRDGYQERAVELALVDMAERPTREGHDVLAWVLYKAGRVEEAVAVSSLALSRGRPAATALYRAGIIAVEAGEAAEGRQLLLRALEREHELDPVDEDHARALLE